jgi:hypothetical protein
MKLDPTCWAGVAPCHSAQPAHLNSLAATASGPSGSGSGLRWQRIACVAAAVLSTALAACGGGVTTTATAGPSGTPTGTGTAASAVNHALLIDLDGVTYSALQAGIQNGSLPNLAKLQVQLAYSGGTTTTSQPNLDTPGWATLLSGAWSERTQVTSDVAGQTIQTPTIFDIEAANGGTSGAAVTSSGLAQLLSPQQNDGALKTLTNCSPNASAASCVTTSALQMINSGYATVAAQYHSAEDAALNFGPNSTQYASTLTQLDTYVGQLVAATANTPNWLVVVTGNHGLSQGGSDDGLNLLSESTTFIAMNQTANNGTAGVNATIPSALSGLYAYDGTDDVAPTLLSYLSELPAAATYALDGDALVNAQPVSQLTSSVSSNNTVNAAVVLNWIAPASGAITIFRDGQQIATLPAGTTTYTDSTVSSDTKVTGAGTYQLNYVVEAATAPNAVLVSVSYKPPVLPLTSVLTGLVDYYPFNTPTQLAAGTSPLDAISTLTTPANSTMGAWASDVTGNVAPTSGGDPFGGINAMSVNLAIADANGYDGYNVVPASQANDVVNQAISTTQGGTTNGSTGAFTIGFWYKDACVATNGDAAAILGNKTDYASTGASAGIIIANWYTASGCGLDMNIGDGTHRVDTDSATLDAAGSAYQFITPGKWVYVAMVVNLASTDPNVPAYTLTGYVFNPGQAPNVVQRSFASLVPSMTAAQIAAIAGVNDPSVAASIVPNPATHAANSIPVPGDGEYGFGLGEDGTGRFYFSKTTQTLGSYNPATNTYPLPTLAFSDLAMWNRALSATELQSIANATTPLSSLMTPSP